MATGASGPDIPETPWDLIAEQRAIWRRLWNRDFSLDQPVLKLGWGGKTTFNLGGPGGWRCPLPNRPDAMRRVEDAEADVRYQIEVVRHEIECLECSREIGVALANTPAFDLIHFGTGVLATAFGARYVPRANSQPAFEPAVHTASEVMKLRRPALRKDGMLPLVLRRIEYYNDVTRGKVILTPADTAGPWSIATSIWHYEDMLEAIYTAPEAVHHLLTMVTDCMIEWNDIQETYIGRWGRTHSSFSWPFLPRGIGVGDDTLVTVSPAMWEEFFLPYNNRLSREYGSLISYHCCMRYDSHFDSLLKTEGFAGMDPALGHNDFGKIESALVKAKGIWFQFLEPSDTEIIDRLRGKVGMIFAVNGTDRADAVRRAKDFVAYLRDPSAPRWTSPYVTRWRLSKLLPARDISAAACARLDEALDWFTWADWFKYSKDPTFRDRFLVNLHGVYPELDGLAYAADRFRVDSPATWVLRLDHDSPARLFVDGACVLTEPRGSFKTGRESRAEVELSRGEHEIVVAIDTDGGRCTGFYFAFEVPVAARTGSRQPVFPALVERCLT